MRAYREQGMNQTKRIRYNGRDGLSVVCDVTGRWDVGDEREVPAAVADAKVRTGAFTYVLPVKSHDARRRISDTVNPDENGVA